MISPLAFPATADGWTDFAGARLDARLTEADAVVAALKDGATRSTAEVLARWNDLQILLRRALSEAALISEVHPERAIRESAEARVTAVQSRMSALMSDPELAEVFARTSEEGLDDEAARLRAHVLRDFRRGGADLEAPVRAELQRLTERDTELSLTFARNIREGRREILVDAVALEGLPEDFLAAHPADQDGRVALSTDATDVFPVLHYARDRGVRHALSAARADLAWPENDPVLAELLEVRHRRAELLGFPTWSDYETEDRMARSSARVASFLESVDDASNAAAEADVELLLARLREEEPDADEVTAADLAYLLTRLRDERFGADAQEVRSFLAFDQVFAGLLAITGRLFDISYEHVSDPSWHSEVRSYDVIREGVRLGRVHFDLHPREGKFNHAASFPLAPGVRGRVLPEAALVCNFPRGLMEHRQVQTFLHELGHLVHDILGGDQEWASFSGVATEWDFVEAPSQLLEEWAWDADVLGTFALDDAGAPIPADLVERMRTADAFGRAVDVRTQLGHARVSYYLYLDRPADLAEATDQLYARSTPVARIPGTHSYASFGHLTEYGSCYYTYQWSLVIARDLLQGFGDDLMDEEAASRYRTKILEPGGSRDAADLIEDFLGRPFSIDAYRAWLAGE